MAGGGGPTLEHTPSWVVAVVCSVIVIISLIVERLLHYLGKLLKKKNQKPLFEALQKIKEELMLLGFISLLLTVFQGFIGKICISKALAKRWLPCKKPKKKKTRISAHVETLFSSFAAHHGIGRHLLAGDDGSQDYCAEKGQAPLLSVTALHHLHIFIFVLAVSHVTFCALTILFGGAKIRQWKQWEEAAAEEQFDTDDGFRKKFTDVHEHEFIKNHFRGVTKKDTFIGWWKAFLKQFGGSLEKADYTTLRRGFIMNHCRTNPKFDFHSYVMRSYEADFKKVVGISWYLWLFVIVFMLVNVHDLHAYFWISFIPFILLIAVGTKLEHILTQLACDAAEKHMAIEGDLIVTPSDGHFWFHRPKLILLLIHIILFQNSFEIAVFFFIWVQYGFESCIMGEVEFIIPRLLIGVFVQFICSYSVLPLYAIVAQMGTKFKKAIFKEHVQEGLVSWAKGARRNVSRTNSTCSSPQRSLTLKKSIEFIKAPSRSLRSLSSLYP